MQRTLTYIPTNHTLPVNKLDTHEYFGQAFKRGECSVALFETFDSLASSGKAGKLRAVWSYGDWNFYDFKAGEVVTFDHTQSRKKTELRFVRLVKTVASQPKLTDRAPQWTLK